MRCARRARWRSVDRLSGVLGPCNLKLGLVLASLSPFALHAPARRFGAIGWMRRVGAAGHGDPARRCARVVDHVCAGAAVFGLAPARARSGWLGVFAFGALALARADGVGAAGARAHRAHDLCADRRRGRRRRRAVRPHPHLGRGRLHGARASGQWRRRARFPRCVPGLRSAARRSGRVGRRARRCMRTRSCWRSSAKPAASACCCGWPARRWPGAHGASRRRLRAIGRGRRCSRSR